MLDKTRILPIIIDALKADDVNSLGDSLGGLGENAVEKAREIAENIDQLCQNYDYFQSKDYLSRIEGKSEAYINFVKQGFSQAHEDRLLEAIRNIEHSDTIYNLIQEDQKQYVNAIRKALTQI